MNALSKAIISGLALSACVSSVSGADLGDYREKHENEAGAAERERGRVRSSQVRVAAEQLLQQGQGNELPTATDTSAPAVKQPFTEKDRGTFQALFAPRGTSAAWAAWGNPKVR